MVIGQDGAVATTVIGVRQLSKAANFDNAVKALLEGRLDPATYNRRWAAKTIGDQVLPDADRLLALARAGLVAFSDFYPSRGTA